MTFQQNSFRPTTLWFEVEFYNYFTGMLTIFKQSVACNIWVATLKAKVTAWPCSQIVSGPKLCYLKSDFTTTFDKQLLCVQYLFGEHYQVPTGSCLMYDTVRLSVSRRIDTKGSNSNLKLENFVSQFQTFLAHLSTKCSWWAIVTGLCLSCVVCLP